MRKIRVFQEDAYLSLDYQNQTGEIHRRVGGRIEREEVEIEREEPLKRQLLSFIECARTGLQPKVSGFEATAALELAVEITRQISAGNVIAQKRVPPERRASARLSASPSRRHPIHLPPLEQHNLPIIIFVTVCTADRRAILASPSAHQAILEAWHSATKWIVGRYIVMPDHLHFFCAPNQPEAPPLEKWMQFWKARATRLLAQTGTVWQRHHWDRQMRAGESYDEKWEYVRRNPVRQGFVRQSEEWPYQGELNELRW